jgi:hypothetical protein
MNSEELKALRIPLAVLLTVIAAVAGAVYYTDALVKQTAAALTRQKGEYQSAQSRMRQSGDEKTMIIQYVDKYRELEKSGFAGEEQRINWLDALRNANNKAELFGISYQIGIQRPYPYAAEFAPGAAITLQESLMTLNMRLLHEGDLQRFFAALQDQQVGLFHVNQCSLLRTDRTETLRNQSYVTANCDLAWITARPAAATGAKR